MEIWARWVYRNGLEWLVGALLGLIVLLSGTQVFFRYVLAQPINWIEEFAQLLLVWAVMLGAAAGIKRNGHLRIDFLFNLTSGKLRCIAIIVVNLLVAVVALGMIVHGSAFYVDTAGDYSTSLGFARNLFYMPIPVSGGLTLVFLVPATIKALRDIGRD